MIHDFFSLTKPQQTIWLSEQFVNEPINNIIGTMYFNSDININILKKATNLVVKNNDAMRTVLFEKDGHIMQFFDDFKPFEIDVLDLSSETDEYIKNICNNFYTSKFELLNNRLFDFIILILPNNEICMIGKFHHIIADAWSLGLVIDNIAINYSNLALNLNYPISPNSYIDFINREQKYLNSDVYEKNKIFWTDKLKDFNPISLKSSSSVSYIANRKSFDLTKEQSCKIDKFCHNNSISPYVLFASALNIYLYRSSMQEDITITTPVLNRIGKEKQTMGMFINMISMRINNNPNMTIHELLQLISSNSISLFKNSKCPYIDVLTNLRKQNPSLNNKSYNIVYSFQNMRPNKQIEGLVDYRVEWNFTGYSADQLAINVTDINDNGNYSISYDYLVDLFSDTEIEYLNNRILTILYEIINSDLNTKISELNIIDFNEKNKLLNEFNNTYFAYDDTSTIISLFEEIVFQNPNNIALKFGEAEFTYSGLNNLANIIAKKILDRNIKNSKIAIMCDKSELMVASLLGILKSGNCYIPIDPSYPEKRIAYILDDSNAELFITTNKYINKYNFNNSVTLDNLCYSVNVDNINYSSPDNLAYIIYTSGTTGNPKGVTIKHKNIVNTLIWRKNLYSFDENDRILQIPSFSFDSSVEDIFTPLISGSQLIIPTISKMDVNIISKDLLENKITHFLVVPSLYKILLKEKTDCLKSLRIITIAGESFSMSLINEHFKKLPNVRIINEYGPTENSVCSTYYEITPQDKKVLIGKPINNCNCYCLDINKHLLPIGCEGELYVSGPGLSSGYLNKSDITNKRFTENPFHNKYKLYNTGDIVKINFDGNMEFIERSDNQVKLHGFRIELKEIESVILENSSVSDALVLIQNINDEKQILVAYIIGENIDDNQIYLNLREKLPYYMIPKLVKLDKFPLTPNGKIDRKKLPIPQIKTSKLTPPKNDLEEKILNICKEVLENTNIGVLDDLFTTANADSLSILTISSKLFNIGIDVGIQDFYKYPTVREIASNIMNHDTTKINSDKNIVKPFITASPEFDLNDVHFNFNNVLLTGSTGFLGIHILDNLLKNTSCTIYCLIREKNKISPEDRLTNLLAYYFDNTYYDNYKNRIIIINSELSSNNLGIGIHLYNELKEKVDCIINCAGNTRHYGDYNVFTKENIQSVQNLIEFAKTANIVFNHISTTNVCGNYLVDNSIKYNFTENDLYIGQNYEDNVYIRSKFEAEKLIIEEEYKGLNANIFRLGNLMGRYTDGMFQKNKFDNAYYTRLLALAKIEHLPDNLKNQILEFSPIDNVSDAIIKLLSIPNLNKKIFHIFSDKLINISTLLDVFNKFNVHCKFVTPDVFVRYLSRRENENILKYIITDINSNRKFDYESGITVNNNITKQYLSKLGFSFNNIDEDYLIRFFTSTNFTSDLNL